MREPVHCAHCGGWFRQLDLAPPPRIFFKTNFHRMLVVYGSFQLLLSLSP
jgi:hypothetical protein